MAREALKELVLPLTQFKKPTVFSKTPGTLLERPPKSSSRYRGRRGSRELKPGSQGQMRTAETEPRGRRVTAEAESARVHPRGARGRRRATCPPRHPPPARSRLHQEDVKT